MTKTRIVILAHSCRVGGSKLGAINLIDALKNVGHNERFLLVCSANCGFEEIEMASGHDLFTYQGSHSPIQRCWFEEFTLPRIIEKYEPHVILNLNNEGVTKLSAAQVLYFRNAYPLYSTKHFPDISLKDRLRFALLKARVKRGLSSTSLVLTQSPVMKERFARCFSYPESQIRVQPYPAPSDIRVVTGLEPPPLFEESSGNFYILVLTRYMAHRNPRVLISLCRHHEDQIRKQKIKFITTVEPDDYPGARHFLERISENGFDDIIVNVGRLSRKDVLRYYTYSNLLWLPTLVESMPASYLEAMTMGIPVLAPDLDFAHDVCGEAAVYYDPWDFESIFSKIMLLRSDDTLRQELTRKGKQVLLESGRFPKNWEEVANNVITDLRQLAKQTS